MCVLYDVPDVLDVADILVRAEERRVPLLLSLCSSLLHPSHRQNGQKPNHVALEYESNKAQKKVLWMDTDMLTLHRSGRVLLG